MTSLRFKTANLSAVEANASAAITGKNGFFTLFGSAPLLANTKTNLGTNVQFVVEGLQGLVDLNFNKHVLEVNDNTFQGLKGADYASIPINEKANTGGLLDFVGYNPIATLISRQIMSYDLANNTINIDNPVTGGSDLYNKLPEPPFYIKFAQLIDNRYISNNTVFIEGASLDIKRSYNIQSMSGSYNFDLGIVPRKKEFISAWVDGTILSTTDISWVPGSNNATITLASDASFLQSSVKYYTTPAIERGDNVQLGHSNIYSVINTSYQQSDATYNAYLTANCVFRVILSPGIQANTAGLSLINITNDVVGSVGNVNVAANSFTVDYSSNTYPGTFELANNKLYTVSLTTTFNSIKLDATRTLRNLTPGPVIIRARNTNASGRKSPFVTQGLNISRIPIKKVDNLLLTESMYIDTTQGVAVRVTISFDHILNQDVTDYEISYKITGVDSDIENFTSVKVPAAGVDSDGKIRYVVNNVNRGLTVDANFITVRVIALNNDLKGIVAEKTQGIVGKSAPPQNVINLSGGQNGNQLTFLWDVPRTSAGDVVDLDLNEIEFRRIAGTLSAADLNIDNWLLASPVAKVSTPSTSLNLSIFPYGSYTYLVRTKDTSGNYSTTVKGITINAVRPSNLTVYRVWSEDDPSANNSILGFDNINYLEYFYTSFANSNNYGLSASYTNSIDNANGTASGWSVDSLAITDLIATANAIYQTQIRDIGQVLSGSVVLNSNGSPVLNTTFNDFFTTLLSGVTEISSDNTILKDVDFGGIGLILSSNSAVYDSNNYTLTSGGISGNVYAIWNPGQFTDDISNANSYALIAGVISNNEIKLGNTYYANGFSTGGNSLPNITTSIGSYQLVNLAQFNDAEGSVTFGGPDNILSTNLEIRYSTADSVYYANGNVNVTTMVDYASNDGWKPYQQSDITFRHLQLRLNITNQNPSLVSYRLDKLFYSLDLTDKTYSGTISLINNPTYLDYSNENFLVPPDLTLTPLSNVSVTASFTDKSNVGANIYAFYTSNGNFALNSNITAIAIGV